MPSVKQSRNAGRIRFSEPASVRPPCITPHLGHTTAIASITLPHAWQYFVGRVSVWLLLMDGFSAMNESDRRRRVRDVTRPSSHASVGLAKISGRLSRRPQRLTLRKPHGLRG